MFYLGCVTDEWLSRPRPTSFPTLQNDFVPCKADGGTKERFLSTLSQLSVSSPFESDPELDGLRRSSKGSTKRMRDAANQFALVARGLEGSGFGYGASQL